MRFWIEDKNRIKDDKWYVLHYGHGESSVAIEVTKQSLIELKTMLEAEGY